MTRTIPGLVNDCEKRIVDCAVQFFEKLFLKVHGIRYMVVNLGQAKKSVLNLKAQLLFCQGFLFFGRPSSISTLASVLVAPCKPTRGRNCVPVSDRRIELFQGPIDIFRVPGFVLLSFFTLFSFVFFVGHVTSPVKY